MDPMLSKPAEIKRDNGWLDGMKILVLIIIVVRHASLPDWFDQGFTLFDRIGKGLVTVTEICLPLFFILTGYIFFRHMPQKPSMAWFGQREKRSVFVVLIPYLIANILTLLVYLSIYKLAPDLLSGFMGDNWKNPLFILWTGPINLSLWFVRELILLCLLAPLIWLAVRYTWGGFVIALGVLWYFDKIPEPLFWFSVGVAFAMLALHCHRTLAWLDRHPIRLAPFWKDWAWFVYLYHYIPQIAMKKIGLSLLPETTSGGLIAVWLGNALLLLAELTLIYYLLHRFTPKLLNVLTGGR